MRAKLVVITGLSGSGKSTVAKCFEDLGYHCVDNLPLPLLRQFLARPLELVDGRDRIAVVADVRAPGFATEFPPIYSEIDREKLNPTLLFLEASDDALLRRFSESRRPHPMGAEQPVSEGISSEREILADVRGLADMVVDTSEWSIHEIRDLVYREFAVGQGTQPRMLTSLVSFGFKFGIPFGADLVFDVRFLPNPHFVPGLREHTGQDGNVLTFLEAQPDFAEFVARIRELLLYLLPRYRRENRAYLTVAIGCTGGRHRSVAVAEQLAAALNQAGWTVRLIHRDMTR